MRCFPIPLAVLTVAIATAGEELSREPIAIGNRQLTVSNRNELAINYRNDDNDVRVRELWYASFDGDSWSRWQKHGVNFDRGRPITWEPPEGHWRIFIRVTKVSGLQDEQPGADTPAMKEFIIDRTAPAVTITSPAPGTKLRAGVPITISWTANDSYLHSTPVTVKWARDRKSGFTDVARNVKNTGSLQWTTPRDMTEGGIIRIEVADRALNLGHAEVADLTVDAIAPSRNILGPRVTASQEVQLQIRAQEAGPAGLATVKLWYSQDQGQTWIEGPVRAEEPFETLAWRAPGNGHFLLNLQAADQAGNLTAAPKRADDALFTTIVDTEEPVITLNNAIGVVDADATENAVHRRVFKPGDQVKIPVSIQDANLTPDGAGYHLQVQPDAPWQVLGEGLDPTQPFTFTIPDVGSETCRVKVVVTDLAGNVAEAVSAEAFRIDNQVERGEVEIDL